METALAAVSRRARSARELRDALARKGYPEDEVTAAVARLSEWRYVDDGELADVLAARGRRERLGKRRIERDLARRGVAGEARAAALEKHYGRGEDEILDQALASALRVMRGPRTAKELSRLARRMIGRGFAPERVFDKLRALPLAGDAWDDETD